MYKVFCFGAALLSVLNLFAQDEPDSQPSIEAIDVTNYGFTVELDRNFSDGYLTIRSEGAPVDFVPTDNTRYEIGDIVGNGIVINNNNFGLIFDVNGANANTTFHLASFAFNQSGNNFNYNPNNPGRTTVTTLSADPGNYYSSIDSAKRTFVSDLTSLLRDHRFVDYGAFENEFIEKQEQQFAPNNEFFVVGRYSNEVKFYTDDFDYTDLNMSREHVCPRSWMHGGGSTSTEEGADYHNLMLVNDNQVNGVRSNWPFGEVEQPTSVYQDAMLGRDHRGETVYEVAENIKGDVARALFYQMVTYNGKNGHWGLNNLADDRSRKQELSVLLDWHNNDPVDDYERSRNHTVFTVQENRNPFIDNPTWVNCIDFATLSYNEACVGPDSTPSAIAFVENKGVFEIYPIPALDVLSIDMHQASAANYVVTDVAGNTVLIGQINSKLTNINVQKLQSGLYFISLSVNNQNVVDRFVKR